ncbi:MAG TPA: hypothetical protein VL501_06815 [Pyrinomonadaceae bacterium]|nr:hypothetical protein [Pyrinomonadaceae bacterium]
MTATQAHFQRESYTSLADPTFTIVAGEDRIAAKLIEVSEPLVRGGMNAFYVTFRTEPLERAEQGVYTIEHAELGTFEMFLVPYGRNKAGEIDLQAICSTIEEA